MCIAPLFICRDEFATAVNMTFDDDILCDEAMPARQSYYFRRRSHYSVTTLMAQQLISRSEAASMVHAPAIILIDVYFRRLNKMP